MLDWFNELLRKIEAGDIGAILFAILASAVLVDIAKEVKHAIE
jgi:hypothetical protein